MQNCFSVYYSYFLFILLLFIHPDREVLIGFYIGLEIKVLIFAERNRRASLLRQYIHLVVLFICYKKLIRFQNDCLTLCENMSGLTENSFINSIKLLKLFLESHILFTFYAILIVQFLYRF